MSTSNARWRNRRSTVNRRLLALPTVLALAVALPAAAGGVVVDHRCTDLAAVPAAAIAQAKATLRIGYGHTSHGSQLVTGLEAIRDHAGAPFDFTASGWGLDPGVFLNDSWGNAGGAADLGNAGDLAWRDATIAMLAAPGNDRNVVVWSWCGGVSDNSPSGIDAYLAAMDQLERSYPAVRFVYMTGHLDGGGAAGNLHARNQQIRAFCLANDKVLFDFADIESYDPGGGIDYMSRFATDGCEYDSDGDGNPWGDRNWAADWLAAHPASTLTACASACGECAHSQPLNCVLKGRAFWWLLARLAGWNGASEEPPERSHRLRHRLRRAVSAPPAPDR